MVLDYEYGINTGNRFINLVDHDEDPEEFIAGQTQPEEKPKKSSKDAKSVSSSSSKKTTTKPTTTTTTTTSTANVSGSVRTNKENLTGKPFNTNQRKQQSDVLSENNNQQSRGDSARGGGRGFPRRGGSAGQDRPPYEGGGRGGGQQRTQRYTKYEGQQTFNEGSGFEQAADSWGNEPSNDNNNQPFGTGYRGRGRGGPRRGNFEGGRGNFEGGRGNYEGGRGNYEGGRRNYEGGRGNYEGGRGGGGRGRGRGGRGGYYNNQNFEDASQEQQRPQTQENNEWQPATDSNFDQTRPQSGQVAGQDVDVDVSAQERPFDQDNTRRGGRGHFRSRTFHNNRNFERSHQYDREGGEVSQGEYRHNRRQHDRQPRNNVSGVKPVEKKEGEGAHNWGSPTENPEENPVSEEINETTGQTAAAGPKAWAQQMDEFEKQMTLDEYKKQLEAKKQAHSEKLPQFNRRAAGEGVDPKDWQKFQHLYRKKAGDDEEGDDDEEEGSAGEENESDEELEEEQASGKKKVITIPLRFKPIDIPRGPAGSRGGPRRGGAGGGRYRDQPRSKSPSQQQTPSYQQPGEFQNDEEQQQQPQRPYRGGSRPGRGEYRRSYGNSARGFRGGYNRSNVDSNTPDFDNAFDFPTLPKQ